MLYSGDGAAARRLAEQTGFADGPRRDSVLAYLAMFADDVDAAERMLTRAWERRALADDARLSATIAQRSAFLATARLRGHEAIEWAQRAVALAPDDPGHRTARRTVARARVQLHRLAATRRMPRSTAGSTTLRRRVTAPASSCSR